MYLIATNKPVKVFCSESPFRLQVLRHSYQHKKSPTGGSFGVVFYKRQLIPVMIGFKRPFFRNANISSLFVGKLR